MPKINIVGRFIGQTSCKLRKSIGYRTEVSDRNLRSSIQMMCIQGGYFCSRNPEHVTDP